MALEDDQLKAMQAVAEKAQLPPPFIGRVVSADPDPLQVVVEGTSVALPAVSFTTETLATDTQVAVLPIGSKYVILGTLGTPTPATPDVPVARSKALTSDTAIASTSLTVMSGLTIVSLSPGTYSCDWDFAWNSSGAINVNVQFDYTGTITAVGQQAIKRVSSAGGLLETQAIPMLSTAIGAASTQTVQVDGHGYFTVSTSGNLTVSFSRASGTSTVQAGSSVKVMLNN